MAEIVSLLVSALTSRASGSQVRIPDAVVPRQQQFRAQIAKFHYPEYFYVSTADSEGK